MSLVNPLKLVVGKIKQFISGDIISASFLGTGATNSATFLRGDNTWTTPASALQVIDTSDSTNSTTAYVNKMSTVFTPNQTAAYKISWSCELTNDNNGNDAIMRVTNNGQEVARARYNPKVNSVYSTVSGFFIDTLTQSTSYTLNIDFTTVVSSRVAHIRRVYLEIHKEPLI